MKADKGRQNEPVPFKAITMVTPWQEGGKTAGPTAEASSQLIMVYVFIFVLTAQMYAAVK